MGVTVLFFAHYKDLAGAPRRNIELPDGATVQGLVDRLVQQIPGLGDPLKFGRVAVNAEFAAAETTLRDGDEVALMPPMSGG